MAYLSVYQKFVLKLLVTILWRLVYKDMFQFQLNSSKNKDFKQTYQDRHLKLIETVEKFIKNH